MDAYRDWRPTTRAQWVSVILTVAVSAGLGLGLPRIADATAPKDEAIAAGERIEKQGVSVEVPAGWVMPGGAVVLVLDKGTAKFLAFPLGADPTSPADAITADAAGYQDVTVGEITPFTTHSGLTGAADQFTDTAGTTTMLFAVSDGTYLARGQVTAAAGDWAAIEAELQAMLLSIEVTDVSSS